MTADLVLQTATHLSAGAGDVADMALIRDARDGGPLLLGTSIAGALWSTWPTCSAATGVPRTRGFRASSAARAGMT